MYKRGIVKLSRMEYNERERTGGITHDSDVKVSRDDGLKNERRAESLFP